MAGTININQIQSIKSSKMASNILQHVKYKHPNLGTKTSTHSNTDSKQKKVLLVKDKTIQIARDCAKVVSQRPEIRGREQEKTSSTGIVPTTKPVRTPKGANPNKDIIQRANKGGGHKLKSLAELATLFDFPEEPEE